MAKEKTDAKILRTARELLVTGGFQAVSFDAIARHLGVSKQAVLYWFPSRADLVAAMFVDWLDAEADAAECALAAAETPTEAIESFVRTIARFHLDDVDRFRTTYLAPQTLRAGAKEARDPTPMERIHATTSRLHASLAARLDGDPLEVRTSAFAIHAATLGLLTMAGLAEGLGAPLKHPLDDLVSALVAQLTPCKGSPVEFILRKISRGEEPGNEGRAPFRHRRPCPPVRSCQGRARAGVGGRGAMRAPENTDHLTPPIPSRTRAVAMSA